MCYWIDRYNRIVCNKRGGTIELCVKPLRVSQICRKLFNTLQQNSTNINIGPAYDAENGENLRDISQVWSSLAFSLKTEILDGEFTRVEFAAENESFEEKILQEASRIAKMENSGSDDVAYMKHLLSFCLNMQSDEFRKRIVNVVDINEYDTILKIGYEKQSLCDTAMKDMTDIDDMFDDLKKYKDDRSIKRVQSYLDEKSI